ncbi:MAG: hypothetical protein P8177_05325 [Gemmatimonadota bacterium]
MTEPRTAALLLVPLLLGGCSDSGGVEPDPGIGPFPALLSDLDVDAAPAESFGPEWPLWTNGALKDRRIWLTGGGRVDISDRLAWRFPDGTRLTKTFSYRTAASPTTPVPIETRVILKVDGQWETAAYLWRSDGSNADLLGSGERVPVAVTLPDGASFEHLVPNRADCQRCHGSQPSFVLGFSELQLGSAASGETRSQLQRFEAMDYFAQTLPSEPARIDGDGERTREVLGYVHANCVHCHNAQSPIVDLDLSHETFIENTVGQPARNGLTLIEPGDPEGSLLFQLFAAGSMPSIGVQRLDAGARSMLGDWIESHDFDP